MPTPRILILTASTGSGHVSAAQAIQSEAARRGICVEAEDVLDHCPIGFRKWYAGGYEHLVRKHPWFWGHLYRSSDRPLFNFWFQTLLDWTFCARLELLITAFKPDWVVCTHSLPQPRLTSLRKSKGFKIGVVVTDIYPHRMWLRGNVDQYFVPVDKTREVLRARLPDFKGCIDVIGMPIRAAFTSSHPRELPEAPIVLLTAGGIGGGPIVEATAALAGLPVQLRVVCGSNKETYAQVEAKFAAYTNVQVLGLQTQEEMAALVRDTDIIVSKPGGLATFESLACGCAFVILHELMIPGQEEGNADFLKGIGAGISAQSIKDLNVTITDLLKNRGRIKKMQHAALEHAMPNAAQSIVDVIAASTSK